MTLPLNEPASAKTSVTLTRQLESVDCNHE
jgi:hypothetical protein